MIEKTASVGKSEVSNKEVQKAVAALALNSIAAKARQGGMMVATGKDGFGQILIQGADDIVRERNGLLQEVIVDDVEKPVEPVLTPEQYKDLLKVNFKGVPTEIKTVSDIVLAAQQREILGLINDGDHMPLMRMMQSSTYLKDVNELKEAIRDGKKVVITTRAEKYYIPLYLKRGGWTLEISEAIEWDSFEKVDYWIRKVSAQFGRHGGRNLKYVMPVIPGSFE